MKLGLEKPPTEAWDELLREATRRVAESMGRLDTTELGERRHLEPAVQAADRVHRQLDR
jgi:hypothetical protein